MSGFLIHLIHSLLNFLYSAVPMFFKGPGRHYDSRPLDLQYFIEIKYKFLSFYRIYLCQQPGLCSK